MGRGFAETHQKMVGVIGFTAFSAAAPCAALPPTSYLLPPASMQSYPPYKSTTLQFPANTPHKQLVGWVEALPKPIKKWLV